MVTRPNAGLFNHANEDWFAVAGTVEYVKVLVGVVSGMWITRSGRHSTRLGDASRRCIEWFKPVDLELLQDVT